MTLEPKPSSKNSEEHINDGLRDMLEDFEAEAVVDVNTSQTMPSFIPNDLGYRKEFSAYAKL